MRNASTNLLLSAAVAGMVGAGLASNAVAGDQKDAKDDTTEVNCWGVNECAGKGACHTSTHDCAGNNSCKGKAWIKLTKAQCDSRGGTTKEPKAEKKKEKKKKKAEG